MKSAEEMRDLFWGGGDILDYALGSMLSLFPKVRCSEK